MVPKAFQGLFEGCQQLFRLVGWMPSTPKPLQPSFLAFDNVLRDADMPLCLIQLACTVHHRDNVRRPLSALGLFVI